MATDRAWEARKLSWRTIREARATRRKAARTRRWSRGIRGEAVTLIARALSLREARRLAGASDTREPDTTSLAAQISMLMLEGPTCLDCLAREAASTKLYVVRALGRMSTTVQLSVDRSQRCRTCNNGGPVYSLKRG